MEKYTNELNEANSIVTTKLKGSRYDIDKNTDVRIALQDVMTGKMDVLQYHRIVIKCKWMPPPMFLENIIMSTENNRMNWYAVHWLNKKSVSG